VKALKRIYRFGKEEEQETAAAREADASGRACPAVQSPAPTSMTRKSSLRSIVDIPMSYVFNAETSPGPAPLR
jgi:hypothetical protein